MNTRIFKVEFRYDEFSNGKYEDTVKDFMNVTAKDVTNALIKVSSRAMKPHSYKDDESKKKINVTRKNFDPINVTLIAEAD